MCAATRNLQSMTHETNNLLILRPGALGDTLMLVPLLAGLQGKMRVTVAARRPGLDLLRSHAARCVDMETRPWHRLFETDPDTRDGDLPVPRPSQVLAFLSDPEGLVERNLCRFFPHARVAVFPGYPAADGPIHAALHLARCAEAAGLPVDPETCLEQARRTALLKDGPPPDPVRGVVVHPGSGGRRKTLSPEFWQEVLERISWEADVTVILGPAEERLRERFHGPMPGHANRVVFSPDMEDLRSLLKEAALYVGHDSGVTHLAAMLGTPTVALFRETDPRVWGPLGPGVQVIRVREESPHLVNRVARSVILWLEKFG